MEFANSAYWRSRLTRNVRGNRPYYLLAALCAILYLPGFFSIPALDPDEPVYAQSVRQMADSHNHVSLNFQEHPLGIRPPGIYWLQSATAGIFGADARIWVYRLPSLFGAAAAIFITFFLGKLLLTPEKALLAAMLLAVCPGLLLAGHLAIPAAALLACILAAQTALAHISKHNQRSILPPPGWLPLVFWLALGAGTLVGGILPLLAAGGAALAIRNKDGSLKNLRGIAPLWAILCGVLVALPWAMIIKANLPADGAAQSGIVLLKTLALALLPLSSAREIWPGANLLWLPLLAWPVLFFVLPGLQLAWRRRTRQGIFCLGWLLPPLLVAGLLPLSGPLLLLAILPPLCLLAADFALSPERVGGGLLFRWTSFGLGYVAALLPALAGGALLWLSSEAQLLPTLIAAGLLTLAGLIFAATGGWFIRTGARLRLGLCAVLLGILAAPVLAELGARGLCRTLPASRIESCLRRDLPPGPAPARLVTLGVHSPSLVFYFGRNTSLCATADEAANLLLTSPGDVAAVACVHEEEFLTAVRARGIALTALSGFSILQPMVLQPLPVRVYQAGSNAAWSAAQQNQKQEIPAPVNEWGQDEYQYSAESETGAPAQPEESASNSPAFPPNSAEAVSQTGRNGTRR